jgi:hypothetical protein
MIQPFFYNGGHPLFIEDERRRVNARSSTKMLLVIPSILMLHYFSINALLIGHINVNS